MPRCYAGWAGIEPATLGLKVNATGSRELARQHVEPNGLTCHRVLLGHPVGLALTRSVFHLGNAWDRPWLFNVYEPPPYASEPLPRVATGCLSAIDLVGSPWFDAVPVEEATGRPVDGDQRVADDCFGAFLNGLRPSMLVEVGRATPTHSALSASIIANRNIGRSYALFASSFRRPRAAWWLGPPSAESAATTIAAASRVASVSSSHLASHRTAKRRPRSRSLSVTSAVSSSASPRSSWPTSRASISATTRLPCSIARRKAALACPCSPRFVSVLGPDGREPSRSV